MACLLRAEVGRRCTRRGKGCGRPSWRGGVRERGGSVIYMGHFVWVFVYPQAITWFLFPDLTYARTLPDMQAHFFFPRWIPARRSMGGITCSGVVPPRFSPPGSLCVQCLLCPKDGKWVTSWSSSQTGLSLLCPCRDCHLQGSTADKAWLVALFQLWLPFRRANSRLAAYI